MDTAVEEYINKCHACQVTGGPSRPEPVKPTELPCERWSSLAIDVCGPFPSGEYVVTLIDYYSRWPEAKIMKSVTSRTILAWLDEVFATHGYPKQIKADNASTLNHPNSTQHSNPGVLLLNTLQNTGLRQTDSLNGSIRSF